VYEVENPPDIFTNASPVENLYLQYRNTTLKALTNVNGFLVYLPGRKMCFKVQETNLTTLTTF
jgi:hypothetical protein